MLGLALNTNCLSIHIQYSLHSWPQPHSILLPLWLGLIHKIPWRYQQLNKALNAFVNFRWSWVQLVAVLNHSRLISDQLLFGLCMTTVCQLPLFPLVSSETEWSKSSFLEGTELVKMIWYRQLFWDSLERDTSSEAHCLVFCFPEYHPAGPTVPFFF